MSSEQERAIERRLQVADEAARRGDVSGTIAALRFVARRAPNPLPVLTELGRYCLRHGRVGDALDAYRGAIDRHPGSPALHFNLAWLAQQDGRAQFALDQYDRALTLGIERPEELHLNRANVLAEMLGDPVGARAELERALALAPRYVPAMLNLGNLHEQAGDREAARAAFQRALDIEPGSTTALARLADTVDFSRTDATDDALLDRLRSALDTTPDPDLQFALGRALEQRGAYDEAWRHYGAGNSSDRERWPAYDAEGVDRAIDRLIAVCTPAWVASLATDRTDEPVFICGMFRSGSTLLEQMLAAHPAFAPLGEREFFPRLVARHLPAYPAGLETLTRSGLAPWSAAYIGEAAGRVPPGVRPTDKRPDNVFLLGLIKAMFPRARFLVTSRDWRDVASSIYATRLGPALPYATDLRDIAHQHRAQTRLVDHWQRMFGADLQIVGYERLVRDPKAALGAVLASWSISWDERCLDFPSLRNPVRTASVWQVRGPLTAGSIGRWRRFEQPFVAAFGEGVRDGTSG